MIYRDPQEWEEAALQAEAAERAALAEVADLRARLAVERHRVHEMAARVDSAEADRDAAVRVNQGMQMDLKDAIAALEWTRGELARIGGPLSDCQCAEWACDELERIAAGPPEGVSDEQM